MSNQSKLKEEAEKRFDKIGFGNQALIKGVKRVELKDFLSQEIEKAFNEGRGNQLTFNVIERGGKKWLQTIDPETAEIIKEKVLEDRATNS